MRWLLIGFGICLIGFVWTKKSQNKYDRSDSSMRAAQSKSRKRLLLNVLMAGFLLVAGFAVFLNINPYIRFVGIIGSQAISGSALGLLLTTGFIGEITAAIGLVVQVLTGVVLWLTLQILQLLPSLLKRDLPTIRSLVRGMSKHTIMPVNSGDHEIVRELKQWHNETPTRWFRTANNLRTFAYVVDVCLCLFVYPPVAGGIDGLMTFLVAGTWSDINFVNLIFIAITIFTVEACYKGWIWARQMRDYILSGKDDSDTMKSADSGSGAPKSAAGASKSAMPFDMPFNK